MPGIRCKCGELLKFGEIPNPSEWLIISDVNYDKFEGKVDSEELYSNMKHILECHSCKRWYFFNSGFENEPTIFVKDN